MTARTRWDVVIVGAGPAGAAAAIAARRADQRASVLLIDRSTFPRDKVCGDGIAPQAFDVLAGLGVEAASLTEGTEPVSRLRLVSPGGDVAGRELERLAHVVPRRVFDARLVAAACAAGAVLAHRRVRSIACADDDASVDDASVDDACVNDVAVDDDLTAGVLIGADGAESLVRRTVFPGASRPGTVAVALRGYTDATPWPAHEQLLRMTRGDWPAYAWAFPVGDGTANVGYGQVLRGVAPTRAHLTKRLSELLPEADPTALRGHRLPLSTGRPRFGRGRVLLTGDAACLINPITGEGIYYAVLSGALAGAAAVGSCPGREYRRGMRSALGLHLRHTDALARLTRAPALVDAAVRASARSQRTFDALVELGLGAGRVDARTAAEIVRAQLTPRRSRRT